jgi:hypothetical protein
VLLRVWFVGLALVAAVGCSGAAPPGAKQADALKQRGLAAHGAAQDRAPDEARMDAKAGQRKILYTAHVHLVVEDFDKAEGELRELVKERGGYVAQANVSGEAGMRRSGTWTVRVPVARFDSFLEAMPRLGELTERRLDSEDVTDQYYDTAAEVRNYEAQERTLRKLYDRKLASSKLSEVLEVGREINTVRGEIDKRLGRLKRWDKLAAYATATVTLQSRKDYVPPVVPDFGGRIGSTFQASVEALVAVGKFLVLAAVALAPWLAVLAVLLVPVLVVRRRRRRLQPPAALPGV